MHADYEIIALLLDDSAGDGPAESLDIESTSRLVRGPEGRMRLEKLTSREELEETAERTGIFKRGKPILDPETGEVMGYELEEIEKPLIASA